MTPRAIILGVPLALFFAAFGYINDKVLNLPLLVSNHLPVSVYGLLVLTVMLLNPLAGRLRQGWRLKPGELGVVVALMLVGGSNSGNGPLRTLTPVLTVPTQLNANTPGWRKHRVLEYVPRGMMPGGYPGDPSVLEGFMGGWGRPGSLISPDRVPWDKWRGPLQFWPTLILLVGVASISLGLIVHRQWASRERLRYPIAQLATSLIGQGSGGGLLRNRLFWIGFGVVAGLHLVNGLAAWNPGSISIPLTFDLSALRHKWPILGKVDGGWTLMQPMLVPTALALGFLLAGDVSLSLGLSHPVFIVLEVVLLTAGVDISQNLIRGGTTNWMTFGSFLGVALLLVYFGRRHYGQVLRQAVTFRVSREVEPYAAWACRVFLLSFAGIVALLVWMGLSWSLAVLLTLLVLMMYLVISRMNAESGLFFNMPIWQPSGVLIGLLGWEALGPQGLLAVGILSAILTLDTRESLMPFLLNGLKISDDLGAKPARVGWAGAGVFALGLAVSIPVALWANYNFGARVANWEITHIRSPFDSAELAVTRLKDAKLLEQSQGLSGLERLTHMHPDRAFLWSAGIGLALVLVVSFLRLRFTWWPLHPIIFLAWGTYPMWKLSQSFLLGWLVKVLVTRLGGGRAYHKVTAFMIGAVAGEMLMGFAFLAFGGGYYLITGREPVKYGVFPT